VKDVVYFLSLIVLGLFLFQPRRRGASLELSTMYTNESAARADGPPDGASWASSPWRAAGTQA